MPPVVGEAATEKLLLPKISDFCSNRHPKVREACVHFLIDLACYVNSLVTENIIVSGFIEKRFLQIIEKKKYYKLYTICSKICETQKYLQITKSKIKYENAKTCKIY